MNFLVIREIDLIVLSVPEAVLERSNPSAHDLCQYLPCEDKKRNSSPYVIILEQPAKAAIRFRYGSEGRPSGTISGVNSTVDKNTFPTIQVVNYVGRAIVVVSCVTIDYPHK